MSEHASERYVTGALALQGVGVTPEDATAIAASLSAQLGGAAAAYAALAFEAEPSGFLVVRAAQRP